MSMREGLAAYIEGDPRGRSARVDAHLAACDAALKSPKTSWPALNCDFQQRRNSYAALSRHVERPPSRT
jgi:hypothetical protein